MRTFLIDTDTASDDAVAIMMALAEPGVRVLGLTTVAGNVGLEQATSNALLTAEICNSDVPVFAGADRPLTRAHQARALVPWQRRPRRSRLPCPEARARARARGRCDPAPRAGRTGPHAGDARAADQHRACALTRDPETRGQDRPLRGDGRRALLRGQCDARRRNTTSGSIRRRRAPSSARSSRSRWSAGTSRAAPPC